MTVNEAKRSRLDGHKRASVQTRYCQDCEESQRHSTGSQIMTDVDKLIAIINGINDVDELKTVFETIEKHKHEIIQSISDSFKDGENVSFDHHGIIFFGKIRRHNKVFSVEVEVEKMFQGSLKKFTNIWSVPPLLIKRRK